MSLLHHRLLPHLDIRRACKSSHAPVEMQTARRPRSAKNAILDPSLVIHPLAFVHVAIGMNKSPTSWARQKLAGLRRVGKETQRQFLLKSFHSFDAWQVY